MSNTPTLETERLILRKFTENDLEALYQIYRDPDVNRFLPWFPLQSMDEARKFFEDRYASLYAEPQAYAYAICLKRGNRPIGYVKVDMAEPHDFGYGLRAEFWHQGIATEAGSIKNTGMNPPFILWRRKSRLMFSPPCRAVKKKLSKENVSHAEDP